MLLPYLLNMGMFGGPVAPPTVATIFPDPFAASAAIKGADPFAASVVARVDPFVASVANKGS
jgi:hypothetical protein